MGAVVTVMNMKGGVGKTTVAMHIGGFMGRYKMGRASPRKVLLIDYDPQFNLSQAYLPPKTYFALEAAGKTTLAILTDGDTELNPYELQVPGNHNPPKVASIATQVWHIKDGGGLDLVPSTLDLMYVALGQADFQIKPLEERFQKFISECRDIYDVILIDCHPAGSVFTKTSLRNSDHVLIPVMPQRYAVRGIGLMMKFMASKKQGTKGPTPHILFNGTARTGVSKIEVDIRADPAFASHCLTNTLKWYGAFAEPEDGQGFVWYSTKPYSTQAFSNLLSVTGEFVSRTGV